MSDPERWTTAADIAGAVRRRWDDGSLLRAAGAGEDFPVIDLPLRGPVAADLGEHYDRARAWAEDLRRAARGDRAYALISGQIGGRLAGATELPRRAVVSTYAQAWRLLGTGADAEVFTELLAAAEPVAAARAWAMRSPLAALGVAAEWEVLLVACRWLQDNRGSGLYLRQVNAPGVDTKVFERHASVLGAMLGVPARRLAADLGFAVKPATVRLRFDPAAFGMPWALSEATVRTAELQRLEVLPQRALIVENEITYLSVPIPPRGVVLWGKGYDADQPASLSWLRDVEVDYWGDLDTHGFGILHRVRTWLPQTRSVLMDRETLLAHEQRWGVEPSPTPAQFSTLDAAESALYTDLVTDRFGPAVRLEQERIDWQWAMARLR